MEEEEKMMIGVDATDTYKHGKRCKTYCSKKAKKKCRFKFAPCEENERANCTQACESLHDHRKSTRGPLNEKDWRDWKALDETNDKLIRFGKDLEKARDKRKSAETRYNKSKTNVVDAKKKLSKRRNERSKRRTQYENSDKKVQKQKKLMKNLKLYRTGLVKCKIQDDMIIVSTDEHQIPLNTISDILKFI